MFNNIKKEVFFATILFVVVTSFMIYSMTKDFVIYDLIYISTFTLFYLRYLKIKKKQKDYMNL